MTRTALGRSLLLVALLLGACGRGPTPGGSPSRTSAGATMAAVGAEGTTLTSTATPAAPDASDARDGAVPRPTAPTPRELHPAFLKARPGTADRRCVAVGRDDEVRSGEFIAGPFREYARLWKPHMAEGMGKLWWIPLHQDRMSGLTVRATRLGASPITRTYRFPNKAWTDDGPFYPSGIPLPSAGRWRLVATSGPDWGCFELTLRPRRR